MPKIVLLPGDGIGPEVVTEARQCLDDLSDRFALELDFEEHAIGGAAIDRHGMPLPGPTLDACRGADAVLLGAVGGPRWDDAEQRPESGLLRLRAKLGLFANLRPMRIHSGLEHLSPLRPEICRGTDMLVVRELTGGIYFGEKKVGRGRASDVCAYTRAEIERVAEIAFEQAARRGGKVTSVDKANVLATSRLWRQVVEEVADRHPDIALDHLYVDAAAMILITDPSRFDVILTENMFGDILSDEMSAIGGSIGLLASISTGDGGPPLFEPIHGSAPDIAGEDRANPAAAISCAAMLLETLGHEEAAALLEDSLERALAEGCRTADLGGSARCSEMGARVRELIAGSHLETERRGDPVAAATR